MSLCGSDWTSSPEEEAAVAPKGWATSSSGGWVDDSAAAASTFFERAPRTHKQSGRSGWSESSPALDSRSVFPPFAVAYAGHIVERCLADKPSLNQQSSLQTSCPLVIV